MSLSKINHNIKHRENPKDVWITPVGLVKECLKLINFKKGDKVLDPAYGTGNFYNNFPSFVEKEWCEIRKDKDFFDYNNKVDWIVTNPPYSKLDKWLRKCCDISKEGFGLLIGWNNLTAKRIEDCNNNGFGLTKMSMFKVFKWFGMSCFVVFEKNKKNIISYNRKVWRSKEECEKKD